MCSPCTAAYECNHPIARIHITQQQQQDSNFQTGEQSLFSSACPIVAMGRQRNLNKCLPNNSTGRVLPVRIRPLPKNNPKTEKRTRTMEVGPCFDFSSNLLFSSAFTFLWNWCQQFLTLSAKYHKKFKAKRRLRVSLLNVLLCMKTQFLSSSQIKNCLTKLELCHMTSLYIVWSENTICLYNEIRSKLVLPSCDSTIKALIHKTRIHQFEFCCRDFSLSPKSESIHKTSMK